jgi:glycosyltransferase involved in cell wall biosynthesis
MKVLALVTDAFGGHGGIALYTRNVLRALCEHPKAPEVTAIPRVVPNALEEMPSNLDFRAGAAGSKVRFLAEAAGAALRRRFDLVVAGHMNLLPLAAAIAKPGRAPLVLFVYGIDAWRPRGVFGPLLVPRVDACVSIRQHTLDRLAQWADLGRVRCHVLENAISLERYGPGPKRADLVRRWGLAGKRVLLTLGRVDDPFFGIDEVLEVLADLVRQLPDVVYLVVGDGQDMPRIRQKARDLAVESHVVFTGYVDDAEKPDYYRLADAFAMPGSHPRYFDRYPLRFTFLEAMACGLPVVASRPEELRSSAESPLPNIYVEPTDRAELAAGLAAALRRGPGLVPAELDRYAYPAFSRRLQAIVDEVVNERARAAL